MVLQSLSMGAGARGRPATSRAWLGGRSPPGGFCRGRRRRSPRGSGSTVCAVTGSRRRGSSGWCGLSAWRARRASCLPASGARACRCFVSRASWSPRARGESRLPFSLFALGFLGSAGGAGGLRLGLGTLRYAAELVVRERRFGACSVTVDGRKPSPVRKRQLSDATAPLTSDGRQRSQRLADDALH